MDTNNICVHCGGPGANAFHSDSRRGGGEWVHSFSSRCIEYLRLRAEAAELSASHNRGELWDEHQKLQAADAKIAQLEGQLARTAFVTNRRPADETDVEVLLVAQWVPGIVPEARGRWRDRHYETLKGVLGWRPRQE